MRGRIALCVAVVLCIAAAAPAFAGDRPNSLRDGAWAIQFGVGDNFRLTTFEGSSFAIKRHFSKRSALRAIVDFGFASGSSDSPAGGGGVRNESENDSVTGNLNLLFQRYLNPDDDVAFYLGAGPFAEVNWASDERRSIRVITGETGSSKRERREFSVGAVGVLGAEYFLIERISLHAEYTAGVQYVDGRTTYTDVAYDGSKAKHTTDGSTWRGYNGTVRFGLSAYF